MKEDTNVEDLAVRISGYGDYEGYSFDCQLIPGDVEVLEVVVGGYDEIPVFLSKSESQILCIAYLWSEEEVKTETRAELIESMMEMNIPMPLSSFSKIGDRYVVFGALSVGSAFEDILHEITTLVENSVEAISAFEDYLK